MCLQNVVAFVKLEKKIVNIGRQINFSNQKESPLHLRALLAFVI